MASYTGINNSLQQLTAPSQQYYYIAYLIFHHISNIRCIKMHLFFQNTNSGNAEDFKNKT